MDKKGDDHVTYKVVYFTRTGNCRRVAKKLAKAVSAEAVEITDNMKWTGVLGFLRGGYYSARDKDVKIKVSGNVDDTDELIAVTPLWAGKVAPTMKAFLKNRSLDKVHLVVTSGGSALKDRAGYKSVSDITISKKNEDEVINGLIKNLNK